MPYPINPNEVCANVYSYPPTLADQGGSKLPEDGYAGRTLFAISDALSIKVFTRLLAAVLYKIIFDVDS